MKFIHVNMTSGAIAETPVPEKYQVLGGRGLTSIMINDRVPAGCDPLGEDNLLIFAPGYLSGTPLVNTGRLSIGAKSPLTGGIKESNVGGAMASALARLGIRAIIIEGKAPEDAWHHLVIDRAGSASLVDARDCHRMGNYALVERLQKDFGEKNAISSIGPAGEMCLKSASIQTTSPDGIPSRAAARGGLGAVMGAKGLKALVVSKQGRLAPPIADAEGFKAVSKRFAAAIKRDGWSGRVLPEYGTASILANTDASGALPTRNARQGSFEGADRINGDAVAHTIRQRGGQTTHKGCSQCIINCSNVYVDTAGNPVTAALEYETLWSMGAMTGIDDLDAIARLDFLCDDIGLDTMNTGVALAVAMDAGAIQFGDAPAAIDMVASVAQGTPMGRRIGNGPEAVGHHLNHSRVPTIKGQSIAGYDPRAMPGMGVTYATSPMGGDHTAGFVGGASGSTDVLRNASQSAQVHMAATDSMGLCMFAQSGGMDNLFRAIGAMMGAPFDAKTWQQLGTRILTAEIDFNRRAGLTEEADRLPKMFHTEALSPHYGTVPYPEKDLHGTFAALRQRLEAKE
ncbi:MAG: aldehyde ferredoxin oxidoreductase C-terminal domain-containing protein [Desulfosarcinaceae bacterium]|nr:aldehyde ferredoxin oxidoreductase C-terminal domain-containing protein [Desulfosarcinaceae bacterium]